MTCRCDHQCTEAWDEVRKQTTGPIYVIAVTRPGTDSFKLGPSWICRECARPWSLWVRPADVGLVLA